jgi:hypothetical protein
MKGHADLPMLACIGKIALIGRCGKLPAGRLQKTHLLATVPTTAAHHDVKPQTETFGKTKIVVEFP